MKGFMKRRSSASPPEDEDMKKKSAKEKEDAKAKKGADKEAKTRGKEEAKAKKKEEKDAENAKKQAYKEEAEKAVAKDAKAKEKADAKMKKGADKEEAKAKKEADKEADKEAKKEISLSAKMREEQMEEMEEGIFDAHAKLFDLFQKGEGLDSLLRCMKQANVTHAAVHGNLMKKSWDTSERRPPHRLEVDGDVYFYTAADTLVLQEIKKAAATSGGGAILDLITPLCCAVNARDLDGARLLEEQIGLSHQSDLSGLTDDAHAKSTPIFQAIGPLEFRAGEMTNIMKGRGQAPCDHKGTGKVIDLAKKLRMPVVFQCNSSEDHANQATRANQFPYLEEIQEMVRHHTSVTFLWQKCGTSSGGAYTGYLDVLDKMLCSYPNLYCSVTPGMIDVDAQVREPTGQQDEEGAEACRDLFKLAMKHSYRVVLGTDVQGRFTDTITAKPRLGHR
jgi:hypothetical protein